MASESDTNVQIATQKHHYWSGESQALDKLSDRPRAVLLQWQLSQTSTSYTPTWINKLGPDRAKKIRLNELKSFLLGEVGFEQWTDAEYAELFGFLDCDQDGLISLQELWEAAVGVLQRDQFQFLQHANAEQLVLSMQGVFNEAQRERSLQLEQDQLSLEVLHEEWSSLNSKLEGFELGTCGTFDACKIVETAVELENSITTEQIVEVEVPQRVEKIVEVPTPVEVPLYVEKRVEVIKPVYVDKPMVIEVKVEEIVPVEVVRNVEVKITRKVQKLVEVPHVQERIKIVEKPVFKDVEKTSSLAYGARSGKHGGGGHGDERWCTARCRR